MKNQMTQFVMFALNYNYTFVVEAFPNNTHILSKWEDAKRSGIDSYGLMVRFWTLLSDDNRDVLAAYIADKYN